MAQHILPESTERERGSVRPFLESVFRHRRPLLAVVGAVLALTIVIVLVTPREYQSEMSILVENSRATDQLSPQRTSGTMEVNGVSEEQVNSEIAVLGSRSLADRVVDPQWDPQKIRTMSVGQIKAHDRAVEQFKKHLSIELIRKSNIIRVTYSARSPLQATDTLTRLSDAFLAKQKEIEHPQGTSRFFEAEASRAKKELDAAQQQLARYQQDHRIVSLPDTEQTLDRQITDAQAQLRNTDVQISEVAQRLAAQAKEIAQLPNRQATQERSLPNDYSVERLNTLLADLQNQRTALLTKFTANDRLVQQIDKQIADTKEAEEKARQMRSEEHSTDVNPVWQQVNGAIVQNQAERQALNAQRKTLADQIAKLQDSLANTEGATVEYTTLRQKVAELETNYQTYSQKRDDAEIADAMDQSRLLNVAIAQAPTFSLTPARPRPALELALGAFTALFLGSFVVFFAEMARNTFSSPQELDGASRYPLLATVPHQSHLSGGPAPTLVHSSRRPMTLSRINAFDLEEAGRKADRERERQVQAS